MNRSRPQPKQATDARGAGAAAKAAGSLAVSGNRFRYAKGEASDIRPYAGWMSGAAPLPDETGFVIADMSMRRNSDQELDAILRVPAGSSGAAIAKPCDKFVLPCRRRVGLRGRCGYRPDSMA